MSHKKLAILAGVAVAMVVWAVTLSMQSKRPPSGLPSHLLQGLDPADIYTIKIGTGEDAVVLTRQEKH